MTLASNGAPDQGEHGHRSAIVKATLYGAGGFLSTVATILVVAGTWEVHDDVTRYALTVVCIIAAIALFVAAFIATRK